MYQICSKETKRCWYSPTYRSTSNILKSGGGTLSPSPSFCSTRIGILNPLCSKKLTVTSAPFRWSSTPSPALKRKGEKKITRTCMLEYSVCVYQFNTISTVRYSQKFLSGEKILLFLPPVRTGDFFFIPLIYFPMLMITNVHRAYGNLYHMDIIFHCNARTARLGKHLCPTKTFGCMV